MEKKNILILGDPENSTVHPVGDVCNELGAILSKDMNVSISDFDSGLSLETMNKYSALLFYAGDFLEKTRAANALVAPLVTYAANGGGIVFIHNLEMAAHPQLGVLMGGRPRHMVPDPDPKQFIIYSPDWLARIQGDIDHPIVAGLDNFELNDEAWFYEMDTFLAFDTLLRIENPRYTPGILSAWVRDYALGRVACLGPGHTLEVFRHPTYREIIRRTALWAAGELTVERPAGDPTAQ